MSLPKRRTTRSKRDMRRANYDKVSVPSIVPCANCSAMMVPHRICDACGFYKGKEVIAQKAKPEAETASE